MPKNPRAKVDSATQERLMAAIKAVDGALVGLQHIEAIGVLVGALSDLIGQAPIAAQEGLIRKVTVALLAHHNVREATEGGDQAKAPA